MSRVRYDWGEIRAHYEAGHTLEECQDLFGFSRGAWDAAVGRGEIVPRKRSLPRQNHHTRAAVRSLLERGMSQTEIALNLGLSKATVCYHVRQLGIQSNDRYARRYDWGAIQQAHDSGMSRRGCLQKFGCSSAAWYDAVRRGVLRPRSSEIPLEELLVAGKPRNRGHLKRRLVKAGVKDGSCEECGLSEWRGDPIATTLHHVNGDPHDHRLENLLFLCPNCHSQTPNYGGRNGHRRPLAVLDRDAD